MKKSKDVLGLINFGVGAAGAALSIYTLKKLEKKFEELQVDQENTNQAIIEIVEEGMLGMEDLVEQAVDSFSLKGDSKEESDCNGNSE